MLKIIQYPLERLKLRIFFHKEKNVTIRKEKRGLKKTKRKRKRKKHVTLKNRSDNKKMYLRKKNLRKQKSGREDKNGSVENKNEEC